MTERKHTPLGEIVPDPFAIDRIMHAWETPQTTTWERWSKTPDAQPTSTMYHDGEMPEDEETRYAHQIFDGTSTVEKIPRVRAALYRTVMQAFDAAIADWQEEFPGITTPEIAEITKATEFVDYSARERIMTAHDITNEDLARLRPRRMQYAMENLEVYRSTLEAQQIPSGLLDTPPYEPQYTVAGCMPACYNMIFNAIAQNSLRAPNQVVLTSLTKYGGHRFDEDVLLQSLSTAHFRQKTGKLVTSKVLIGADFDDIARRAALVKQKRHDASVYATVGIKNFDSDYGEGLHGVVLLGVTEDTVSFHNPYPRKHHRGSSCSMLSTDGCGAFDTLDKAEFIERWAVGMHEARLVIARSDPSYTG